MTRQYALPADSVPWRQAWQVRPTVTKSFRSRKETHRRKTSSATRAGCPVNEGMPRGTICKVKNAAIAPKQLVWRGRSVGLFVWDGCVSACQITASPRRCCSRWLEDCSEWQHRGKCHTTVATAPSLYIRLSHRTFAARILFEFARISSLALTASSLVLMASSLVLMSSLMVSFFVLMIASLDANSFLSEANRSTSPSVMVEEA
mmetsp:Transcript_31931/g.70173  ORF Transcript_31931/g.70173 Transcript_31931/m.70173 type:complete len:204 (+) Transcript_31931:1562-2173(+)